MQKQLLSPSRILEGLLFLLFVISPFYITSSIGGTGFDLPFNISVWFAATLVIGFMLWHFASSDTITLPKNYLYLLMLPAGILLSAVIAGVVDPVTWLFRILYILAGVIFLFGLFQFKSLSLERVLFFIVLSGLLVSIYGVVQIHQWHSHTDSFLLNSKNLLPTTIFQQVNVTASYLVTAIFISVYLLFDKWSEKEKYIHYVLFLTITLSTYVVVSSGSRTGLLSLSLGLVFVTMSSAQNIRNAKSTITTLILLMMLAAWAGHAGLNSTVDKTYRLIETSQVDNIDARLIIYGSAVDSINASPVFGHGIGSFNHQWLDNSLAWYEKYPNANVPKKLEHPHNEMLMWAVEGGVMAVAGIFVAFIITVLLVFQAYGKKSFIIFATLLPISLHSMVEHPFYISSLHWFVWLFLIFFALKPISLQKNSQLSNMARVFLKGGTLLFVFVSTMFLYQTAMAQKDVSDYAFGNDSDEPLKYALENVYFQELAKYMATRGLLYHAIQHKNNEKVSAIVNSLVGEVKKSRDLSVYIDIINGYETLSKVTQKCETIHEAIIYYPWNKQLRAFSKNCDLK